MTGEKEPTLEEWQASRFESRGMTHRVKVWPTTNDHSGKALWLMEVTSMGGTGLAYISREEGLQLAALLMAGPGEDQKPALDLDDYR